MSFSIHLFPSPVLTGQKIYYPGVTSHNPVPQETLSVKKHCQKSQRQQLLQGYVSQSQLHFINIIHKVIQKLLILLVGNRVKYSQSELTAGEAYDMAANCSRCTAPAVRGLKTVDDEYPLQPHRQE